MTPLVLLMALLFVPAAAAQEPLPSHALPTIQETRLLPSAQACRQAAQALVDRLPPPAQATLPAGRQGFSVDWTPAIPGHVSLACRPEGRQWRLEASVQGF